MEMIELAKRTAEEHGRDPEALNITTTIPDDLDDIPKLAAAGVKRLMVPAGSGAGPQAKIDGPEDVKNWRSVIEQYADV